MSFDPGASGWTRLPSDNFLASIAAVWQRDQDGLPCIGIVCEPRHDNGAGKMHGGIIMTLADMGLGRAVGRLRNRDREAGAPWIFSPTAQLDVHFTGPVSIGDFVYCRPELSRLTRSLVFMRGTLHVGDGVVASAQGVFKTRWPEKRETGR